MDITLQRRLLLLALGVALAVVLAAGLPKAASAAPPGSGGPPDAINTSLKTVGSCDFPVQIDISGKAKTVQLPGGRTTLVTSPGARATLTNLAEPANQVSYLITGVYHQTEQTNGDVEVVTTGRALLFDQSFGMFLVAGRYTFTLDEEGSFVQPPTGTGRMVDVCALLA
jgi:hypothetical protein